MANKNLIKRAFSVTANLPGQRPEGMLPQADESHAAGPPTLAISPAPGVDERPPAGSIAVAAEAGSAHRQTAAPRTSPGSMLAFMAEQSEVHKEVVELRQRLEAFDGADVVKRLDPLTISVSKWANRDRAHFATEAFANLKAEIDSAGGNIQPIKVRTVPGAAAGTPRFEIVYGHRRHQACLELGLPVLALVEDGMKDSDLFVEMDRENREREDLSPWEQGVMYSRALDEGLFPSAKQLAAALGVDMGTVSKAKTLSALPEEVVAAFPSPLDLQFRWGKLLTDALQKDPEGVLERARMIAKQLPRPSPTEALKLLTQARNVNSAGAGAAAWINDEGKEIATMRTDRKGRVTVSVDTVDDAHRRRLVKLLDTFLGVKAS